MKNALLLAFILIFAMSCEKDLTNNQQLRGTWIEAVHKTDTIVFKRNDPMFILYRGTEMRNTYELPKFHSGPYTYVIEEDSIRLHWGLSSSLASIPYHFKMDEKSEAFEIGNFFSDSVNAENAILVFLKADD
jgi:hypothetical protein